MVLFFNVGKCFFASSTRQVLKDLRVRQELAEREVRTRSFRSLWYTYKKQWKIKQITLWLFNIAMGNCPFIEVYLVKMVIFHGYV